LRPRPLARKTFRALHPTIRALRVETQLLHGFAAGETKTSLNRARSI